MSPYIPWARRGGRPSPPPYGWTVSGEDRLRWDGRYGAGDGPSEQPVPRLPSTFAPYEALFPSTGSAVEVACGCGETSVWLAARGMDVVGWDISPVALGRARRLAVRHGVSGHCRFEEADLDHGLPAGPSADVIVCHMFRDRRLYRALLERLKGDGLLAIAVMSQVGTVPGAFRAVPGELARAFRELSILAEGEGGGRAWLLGRRHATPEAPEGPVLPGSPTPWP